MASGSTPVKGRPYPLESDVPDVAADMHSLALSLDAVPNFYQGSLAGRASVTPTIGDRYVVEGDATASNNGIEYYWTGTAWIVADQPTWTNLTPISGFVINPSGPFAASRKIGDTVELQGTLLNNSGGFLAANATFATLPTGMRPSVTRSFTAFVTSSSSQAPACGNILPSGAMAVFVPILNNPGAIWLDGVTFVL